MCLGAIEAMGANPVQKLVVPRVLATIIATPILTVMADVIGTLGGMVIAVREAGVTPRPRRVTDPGRSRVETGPAADLQDDGSDTDYSVDVNVVHDGPQLKAELAAARARLKRGFAWLIPRK